MKQVMMLCMIMLWNSQSILGQTLNSVLLSSDTIAVSKRTYGFLEGAQKDGTTTLRSLFHFYKHYVSSQDGQSCKFSPSCSEYAFISIKKHGLIIGVFDFFDRFARCNPIGGNYYYYDLETHLFIDPVE